MLHNNHLQQALMELRLEFPHVQIVYGDYYKAFMALLRNPVLLGFRKETQMKACCGFGGPYNFHPAMMCGNQGIKVCLNPTEYIHWDGFHLIQEALKHIVEVFMSGRVNEQPDPQGSQLQVCSEHKTNISAVELADMTVLQD
ncbi:hypothetical protein RHSIM_Rhsim05G0082000 [Rhododendron simsii]|uniref:GDSL esterase/lipase n=1 Tax=Rhododendron simsii TaxID=118357 RepID=A0A834LPL3_RHOSS|nr:hypothetical protein RHSIM_Rhsim05G0082000 [Rhododendron simsii]